MRTALVTLFALGTIAGMSCQPRGGYPSKPAVTTETSVFVCSPYPDPACTP